MLLPCERTFFEHAYKTNDQGRLVYPEQGLKKTGKTGIGRDAHARHDIGARRSLR